MLGKFFRQIMGLEQAAEDALEKAERRLEHAVEDATDAVIAAEHKAAHTAVHGAVRLVDAAASFFRLEAAGGIVLVIAAAVALLVANTFMAGWYDAVFNQTDFRIGFSHPNGFDMELKKSILLWINDGLMAVFFFLVGLEIKREVVAGELSTRDRALLPALAALGGMAVPALVYAALNAGEGGHMGGWAIPAATDIAFALGVLALAGSRAPFSLKVLLTAIAVIDDLGAILIIAIFYNHGFNPVPLYFAAVALAGLLVLNRRGVAHPAGYVLLGIVLWVAVLESGIHATLAGVITALFIPMSVKGEKDRSPCHELEHALHPWVAFGVLPLFAFANAGVPFAGMGVELLGNPVTLGIAGGLFAGKQLGVFAMLALAIKSGLCPMPKDVTWPQLYAVAVLCGIGFTMSLFIGGLAFHGVEMQAAVRVGVLGGSILSAGVAYGLLRLTGRDAKGAA
jgi:NhaA family Na+:H+ antiporter